MAELVRDGENGLKFKPGDADDLARQLRRLLDEPGLLARLQAGIEPVKSLSQEMDELEGIYQDLVERKGNPVHSRIDQCVSA
jgi:glycosyltransferase involved in cell wall biosynthesis